MRSATMFHAAVLRLAIASTLAICPLVAAEHAFAQYSLESAPQNYGSPPAEQPRYVPQAQTPPRDYETRDRPTGQGNGYYSDRPSKAYRAQRKPRRYRNNHDYGYGGPPPGAVHVPDDEAPGGYYSATSEDLPPPRRSRTRNRVKAKAAPIPLPPRPPVTVQSQTPLQTSQAASNVPATDERRYVSNEVVIEVNGRPTPQEADALAQRHSLRRVELQEFPLVGTTMFRWVIPDNRSVSVVIRQLEADGNVRSAQPNYVHRLQQASPASRQQEGDPSQYTIAKLHLPQAHGLARGGNVLIAVIDSGIDLTHPELAGVIAGTFDALGSGNKPHSHGTAIAGAIAAHSRLMGVAPGAQILAAQAFGESSKGAEGTTFNILKSIEWAMRKGARIINMSFAGPNDPAIHRSLEAARKSGIILIAAAGNAGPKSPPLFPAADSNVIAVTATDIQDKLFGASNRGRYIAVAAPGVDILLPGPDGTYQLQSGTSFAAAHVSGVAALILERNGSLDPVAVRKILLATARDLGPRGFDSQFGAGLVDAFKATSSVRQVATDTAAR